jgi:hypothetical protein
MVPVSDGHNAGLSVKSYAGDSAVLLAFNLDESMIDNLAGFSIHCTAPHSDVFPSNEYWLTNPLNFRKSLTKETSLSVSSYTQSNKAPFQMFHWVHFPSAGAGTYQYKVYASYIRDDKIELGPSVTIKVDLNYESFPSLELGFTRGYISSQAYVHKFDSKKIDPQNSKNLPIDFDTSTYEEQYKWLGAHARKLLFEFLRECLDDSTITVDVFAFNLDEPDIINQFCRMGDRVRMFRDNSADNSETKESVKRINDKLSSAGVKLITGKMSGLAHNKVIIQKKKDKAIKILTGSANFTIRGLYVQSNSVLVFKEPYIADLYEKAFEQSYTDAKNFKSSEISSKWYLTEKKDNRPTLKFSFAPHAIPFTIDSITEAIEKAQSSVLFAIMTLSGGGNVFPTIKGLHKRDKILALGITQTKSGISAFRPNMDNNAEIVTFDYLNQKVPKPFVKELAGGSGIVIHHKFVVCDFNDSSPVLFCGSSNLSSGGETHNGDNLIAFYDKKVATSYAVEAIRLFDHYRFRNLSQKSTASNPLILDAAGVWIKRYYDKKNIKFLERKLLSRGI